MAEIKKEKKKPEYIKKLIKKLQEGNSWYIQSIYLDNKFIKETFIDFLSLIEKDKRFLKDKPKNDKALISIAVRFLINAYVQKIKQRVIQNNEVINETSPD